MPFQRGNSGGGRRTAQADGESELTDLSFQALRSEYETYWERISARGGLTKSAQARAEAKEIIAPTAKARFLAVEERTGVPWFMTGIILTREAGSPPNFHAWLHNGDPMFDHDGFPRQTVNVPARR